MEEGKPPYYDDAIQRLIDFRLSYLGNGMGVLHDTIRKLGEIYDQDELRNSVFTVLGARVYNHLLASLTLFRLGLPLDCLISARSAMETFYLLMFLDVDDDRIRKWKQGEQFHPSEVRKMFKDSDLDNEFTYRFLSEITHPNYQAHLTHSEPSEENNRDQLIFIGSHEPTKEIARKVFLIIAVMLRDFLVASGVIIGKKDESSANLCQKAADDLDHAMKEILKLLQEET